MASEKTVLLFGKTGSGKSSLGNTILQKPGYFTTGAALGSVTNLDSLKDGKSDDGRVLVFDTIGIGDTVLPPEQVADSIAETVSKIRDGIDVMVFVMEFGRITEHERKMFLFIVNHLFGPAVLNNMYLVFTKSPESLVDGSVADRTAYLEKEAAGSAEKHFGEIWAQMNRNVHRMLFVDNPDPASTTKEHKRVMYAQQVTDTRRQMMEIIDNWHGARYRNTSMDAARVAYDQYLADEEKKMQDGLKAQAEQIAKREIDATNARSEAERQRWQTEIEQMKSEHMCAIKKAHDDAAQAAEKKLREELKKQARAGHGDAFLTALMGAAGSAVGSAITGVTRSLMDKAIASKDCAIM